MEACGEVRVQHGGYDMKKFMILFIAGVLGAALMSGCGKSDDTTSPADSSATTSAPKDTTATTAAPADTSAPATTAAPADTSAPATTAAPAAKGKKPAKKNKKAAATTGKTAN